MDNLLPIAEAAVRYNMSEHELQRMIHEGTIKPMNFSGVILVSEEEVQQQLPKEEREEYKQFAGLKGKPISVTGAAEKYKIPHPTISRWVANNYISKLGYQGRKTLIDEADVAYCAYVYHHNRGSQGKWLFSSNGTPYLPKGRK